jgi:hypothetical protein
MGQLKANFANGPYSFDVFVTTSETIPASLTDWGLRVGNKYSTDSGLATVDVKQPARNVLLMLREMGRSGTCSVANPHKTVMNDLSFTSAK